MDLKKTVVKRPSAWVPVGMSLTAIMMVLGYVAVFGITRNPQGDEGMAARIFQLLLAGQVPIMMFLAIKHWPQKPKETLEILVVQIAAALGAWGLVFVLEL